MRADRLLSILLSLQARGRITASQLATELEVSQRTVHRDMEALSIAGVPVYAERGRGGGWALPDGYRSGLRGLRTDELRALFVATPGTVLGDLGLDRASESALTKLLLAIPPAERRELEQARQRVLVDVAGWRPSEPDDMPSLALVQDAVLRERQLVMRYGRADGEHVERLVHPLGLVAKGPIWYLVAATDTGDVRTYRVSRILSARVSQAASRVPDGFDLPTFWEASKSRMIAGVPHFAVVVRAQSRLVSQFKTTARWSRIESVGEADADGWQTINMRFELEEDVCAFVLSLGPGVELLEPSHLRAQIATRAAATAAAHFQTSRASSGMVAASALPL